MIQLDMIKWISQVLQNETEQLSDYSIEYATALLMNLSLRSSGKDKCEQPDIQLLKVLNELVEHENPQVRTYVNGTLYSIFTRKKLREQAKELGMPEVLQYLMNQVDDQFKRQIQYILEQLNNQHGKKEGEGESDMFQGENGEEAEREDDMKSYNGGENDQDLEDDEDEEDDEDDILEEDDGEFNDIIDEQGIMVGEDWLISEFILPQEQGEQQVKAVIDLYQKDREKKTANQHNASASGISRQSPYSNVDGRPPMRPITPIKSSQTARVQHTNSVINSTQQNIDYYNVSGPIA